MKVELIANGLRITLTTRVHRGCVEADQPYVEKLVVSEVRLVTDAGTLRVRVLLTSFTLENEGGRWCLWIRRTRSGKKRVYVEYFATAKFGERVRDPVIFAWDQDHDELIGQ